jgi:hypothetical protein
MIFDQAGAGNELSRDLSSLCPILDPEEPGV